MDKHTRKQIFYRVILSSPVIAFLILTPVYLVFDSKMQTFFELWSKTLTGALFWWGIQILTFYYFKKRNYPNWAIGISILGLVFLFVFITKNIVTILTPGMMSFSNENRFVIRIIINISVNFIIFLLLDLIYSREEKLRLVMENTQLQYQNIESKYKLLKAQINPHFLFNALNISKSLIKTKPKDAEKYIIGLSEFLRNSLNDQQKSVALKKELLHCQQYIELQKVRFENAIEYDINIEEVHLKKHLPFFTLITLIENAIKHNAFSIEDPLKISGRVKDDYLCIKNEIRAKKGVISNHSGLSNLNERSQMLSGQEIQVENDGQTFTVKVKLIEE